MKKDLVITILAVGLVVLAMSGVFDAVGRQYTDAGLKRALVTFAAARGLNAVISVAQGTEVAMEPAGIGVIFTPGQILDPVNDLVERFSWVMLVSSSSLGLQGLLLKIFSSSIFTLLLVLLVGISLLLLWRRRPFPVGVKKLLYQVTGAILILRFCIPVMAVSSEAFYHYYLASEYQTSTAYLTETQEAIGGLNMPGSSETGAAKSSWYERLQGGVRGAIETFDVEKQVAALQSAVRQMSEHIINLVVVFVLQTILFPFLFLWLAMKSVRQIFKFNWKV